MRITLVSIGLSAPALGAWARLERVIAEQGGQVEFASHWRGADGLCVVAGDCGQRLVRLMLAHNATEPVFAPESMLIKPCRMDGDRQMLLLSGADSRGLAYAVHEMADRVLTYGLSALEEAQELAESPALAVRGVGRFLMSRRDDEWFFDEAFWRDYLMRLSQARFNRFALITGFDTAYMSPPYPFIVRVPGFEQVHVDESGYDRQRERTLQTMRLIGDICHENGLEFIFATWQQKPWTSNQRQIVDGLPDDEGFAQYCKAGMTALLTQCPQIDGVSMRVNLEAGVRVHDSVTGTDQDFWGHVVDGVRDAKRPVRLDLRAKGLTDEMIEYVLDQGLPLTVPTKYWCEHAALPYHIPKLRAEEARHMDNLNSTRRYSFDDLLRHGRSYDMLYRLWNYGSTNLLLWGDSDYAARFAQSCEVGDSLGFEITAPLSLKGGHATLPGDSWPIHVSSKIKSYEYEDQRYWYWYQSFGRMGYNPRTGPDVFEREFVRRFGQAAGDMMTAYHAASRILPLITTAHFPVHPSLHYWPELYTGAALFAEHNTDPYFKNVDYAHAKPSDEELFHSVEAMVEYQLGGERPRGYSPSQVRDWYWALAQQTDEALAQALGSADLSRNSEFYAAKVDFTMLLNLARFHAWKVKSAMHLLRYQRTNHVEELIECYRAFMQARSHYALVSDLGSQHYARNLVFDAGDSTVRNGNWQDRLDGEIRRDMRKIQIMLAEQGVRAESVLEENMPYASLCSAATLPVIDDDIPEYCLVGEDLRVRVAIGGTPFGQHGPVKMHYRRTNHRDGEYRTIEMRLRGDVYEAVIPGRDITEDYDLFVYISGCDTGGNAWIHPGVGHPTAPMPYRYVRVR